MPKGGGKKERGKGRDERKRERSTGRERERQRHRESCVLTPVAPRNIMPAEGEVSIRPAGRDDTGRCFSHVGSR